MKHLHSNTFRHFSHIPLCRTLVALASLQVMCVPVHALDIVYTGQPGVLQVSPFWDTYPSSTSNSLYPGTADEPQALQNSVTVDYASTTVPSPMLVMGGLSRAGAVQNNTVTIQNGSVGAIYGGYSPSGNVSGNRVVLNGGALMRGFTNFYGGYSTSGDVSHNTFVVNAGVSIPNENTRLVAAESYSGQNIVDNHIVMNGSVVGNIEGGYTVGTGTVSGNSATVNGGTVTTAVRGGGSYGGTASNNTVNIQGGYVKWFVYGGQSFQGDASGNTVNLNGGMLNAEIYGGRSEQLGNAIGNTVNIGGNATLGMMSTLNGSTPSSVYGGYSMAGNATGNTINISGHPVLTEAVLYGGQSLAGGDAFTGNTLNVNGFRGTVKGIANFENYNFFLPASLRNGNTMLTVTDPVDISHAQVSITGIESGAFYHRGDSFKLIDATAGLTSSDVTLHNVRQGVTFLYDINLSTTPTAVVATVASNRRLNPQSKALSEARIGGLAFTTQGADLVANDGIGSAMAAAQSGTGTGWRSFGALGTGASRYQSGSHVDVNGVSLLVGAARQFQPDENSKLTFGVFAEGGQGNYDSYNSFNNMPSVKGDGDTSYYGVGALLHYELGKVLYVDGSVRVGRSNTDFDSADMYDAVGHNANYDSDSTYYGAHIGVGTVVELGTSTRLDISSKYLWTHQGSDDVSVLGDQVHFDSSNSQRWRNGVRVMYAIAPQADLYAGAAYEYEFDGKAGALSNGERLNEPSIKGGTGVFELGFNSTVPAISDQLSLRFSLLGYAGRREGAGGSMQMQYLF